MLVLRSVRQQLCAVLRARLVCTCNYRQESVMPGSAVRDTKSLLATPLSYSMRELVLSALRGASVVGCCKRLHAHLLPLL
jgi:hypothetical protein